MNRLLMLIKPVSGHCNMRCQYCFYADVTNRREKKNNGAMSYETLEKLVCSALSETTEMCVFGFQGGEPTLAGIDFFKTLIKLEEKYNINSISINHSIQTNGLLLNDEWCEFLSRHRFLTGISIDGSKEIHNTFRIDANGKATHNRCLQATQKLSKHKAEYNVLSVVTNQLAAHPDKVYHYYKKQGFRHLQFIPCIDGFEEQRHSHSYSLDSNQYGDFLCRIFDLWYEDFIREDYYSIRNFDNYIYMLAGYPPENCATSGTCSTAPLVEADGSVYPCDFYAFNPYCLGNIHTHSFAEMLAGATAMEFIRSSQQAHPQCEKCSYYSICRGGCRRDRELTPNSGLGLNKYCTAYKQFFDHAIPQMTNIARHGFGATPPLDKLSASDLPYFT